MNKDELKALGLNDDQVNKIIEDQGKNFVPKTRFNEVNEAKKGLETNISERDKQLTELKKTSGNNEELKKQIEALQEANKTQAADFQVKLQKMTIDNIVSGALTAAKAKNINAARAMLKLDKYELEGDKVKGLEDAIATAKKENAWAFDVDTPKQTSNGINLGAFKPAESGDTTGASGANTVAATLASAMGIKLRG